MCKEKHLSIQRCSGDHVPFGVGVNTHTSTKIKERSPQIANQQRKSVSLTCCSVVMLQRGRVITEGEIGSPCLFFNCLAAFNRTHLSLQHVEIPNPLNVLNTSHGPASINCSNLPVLQPHTCPARLLWHTPRIIFFHALPCISTASLQEKRGQLWTVSTYRQRVKLMRFSVTPATTLLPIYHTRQPISLAFYSV